MFDPLSRSKAVNRDLRSLLILAAMLFGVYVIFVYPHVDDLELSPSQCAELNTLWQEKYRTDFSFSNDWSPTSFDCPSQESGMAGALKFLDEFNASMDAARSDVGFYQWAQLQKPLFGKKFMMRRVGKTRFDSRRIDLSENVLMKNNPVQIAGVLVHELRHLEQGANTHVPCRAKAHLSCDAVLEKDPRTGGAYNFNMLFFHLIRQNTDTTRFQKHLARKQMQTIFDTRFNAVPKGARELYALDLPR